MSNDVLDPVQTLGQAFWAWRAVQQPHSGDDIPRLPRPAGWLPDFTVAAVDRYRTELAAFDAQWQAIDAAGLDVTAAVDHRLLGSALARVRWELDVMQSWRRDPVFHIQQALGPYFDLLLPRPPFDEARAEAIVTALAHAPAAFATGRAVLDGHAATPLIAAAVEILHDIETVVPASTAALAPHLPASQQETLVAAGAAAAAAAAEFRDWLGTLAGWSDQTAVGRDAFVWYLRNVALMWESPEDLLRAARQDWERAVVWEAVAKLSARDTPLPAIPATAAEQAAREAVAEQQVRDHYERVDLLTQPATLRHYLNEVLPDYIAPISWLGVNDDLTDDHRLDEDGLAYVPAPREDLPYFYAANARDPRCGIVHEGAHYQQLALAKGHADPIRRRYYDSGSAEGIAFYNEEWLLQSGLFDDAPHSKSVIWNFARLRTLRVEVDVRLAIGEMTLAEGVDFFVERVPMDRETAFHETAMYAGNPGLALSYETGKVQLLRLAAAAVTEGRSIREIHDYLWLNGNVPFSLLRWELLGRRDELDLIDADPLTGVAPPTVFSD